MTSSPRTAGLLTMMALLVGAPLYVAVVALYDRSDGPPTTGWFAIWAAMVLMSALVWVVVLRAGVRRLHDADARPSAGATAQ